MVGRTAQSDMERVRKKRLGDILVDEGLVGKEAVIAALHEQQRTKRLLSDILIEGGSLDAGSLASALVSEVQAPFLDIANYSLHKDLVKEFPGDVLYENAILPLDRFGEIVTFACQEVPPPEVLEQLRLRAPGGIYLFVALGPEIRRRLAEVVPVPSAAAAKRPDAAAEEEAPGLTPDEESGVWKELFDSANESVLNEITQKPKR